MKYEKLKMEITLFNQNEFMAWSANNVCTSHYVNGKLCIRYYPGYCETYTMRGYPSATCEGYTGNYCDSFFNGGCDSFFNGTETCNDYSAGPNCPYFGCLAF